MTLVIAHRGASAAAPENTVAAFELARAMGADGVELDVRLLADGGLAVHHDAVLADGRRLAGLPRAALPAHVPTLATALAACRGMVVAVELKTTRPATAPGDGAELARRCVETVKSLRTAVEAPLDVWFSSFDPAALDAIVALDANAQVALLREPGALDWPDVIQKAAAGGYRAVHPFASDVTPALVDEAHAAGLAVWAWTVDDPATAAALARTGIDGLITNVPDVTRAAIEA